MAEKTTSTGGKFQFVGARAGGKGDKIEWPMEVQAAIIKTYLTDESLTAREIFALHLPALNEALKAKGRTEVVELPKSYQNTNAGSLLHGMRTRFLKRCDEGDKATLEVANAFGLVEPKPAEAPKAE